MLEPSGDDMSYFRKQAFLSVAALIVALGGSQIDYHLYARFAMPIYWVSVFLLFITKFVGRTINGARRWIYFGPISFQPAELAKVAVILFLPVLIVKIGRNLKGWKAPGLVFAFGFISAIFTFVFTDNLSTAIIILGIATILIFIAHPKTVPFLIGGAIGIVAVVLLVFLLVKLDQPKQQDSSVSAESTEDSDEENFRVNRIRVWLDPEANADDGGYQVIQGLYAIGSGGFFGKGLGKSTQKLGALPEAQNDMIFSIICEELGVFGAALVILMFVFMLFRLYVIAQDAPDLLGSLIASGIFVHIALQVVLNIAVVTNLIPTTGITLPFVSYGGTSIVFLMLEMALALSVSGKIKDKA